MLVLAYVGDEDSTNAVPYDIVEIASANDKKALLLGKGVYNIVAKDQEQHTQTIKVRMR